MDYAIYIYRPFSFISSTGFAPDIIIYSPGAEYRDPTFDVVAPSPSRPRVGVSTSGCSVRPCSPSRGSPQWDGSRMVPAVRRRRRLGRCTDILRPAASVRAAPAQPASVATRYSPHGFLRRSGPASAWMSVAARSWHQTKCCENTLPATALTVLRSPWWNGAG